MPLLLCDFNVGSKGLINKSPAYVVEKFVVKLKVLMTQKCRIFFIPAITAHTHTHFIQKNCKKKVI